MLNMKRVTQKCTESLVQNQNAAWRRPIAWPRLCHMLVQAAKDSESDSRMAPSIRTTGAVSDVENDDKQEASARKPMSAAILIDPISTLDVDAELWQVLDLCSDEELEAVYSVLHAPSPFSPVVKSLVTENEPPLVEQRGRLSLMHKIESRFRFLAADQNNLLRGRRPSYRDTLLAIRDRLDVPCSTNLSTFDLETEVFLHVLHNCVEYVQEENMAGSSTDEAAARATVKDGDGMTANSSRSARGTWVEQVTAPILFGVKELVPTLAKFGSVLTVTAVSKRTAAKLAQQLLSSHLTYQAAAKALGTTASRGAAAGATMLGAWGKQKGLEAAARGLTAATARYSALQGALSFLGPVMWGWLAVDVALKAIGTDYARVIRAVFILAQVRLVRTSGFQSPPAAGVSGTINRNSKQKSSNSNAAKSATSAVPSESAITLSSQEWSSSETDNDSSSGVDGMVQHPHPYQRPLRPGEEGIGRGVKGKSGRGVGCDDDDDDDDDDPYADVHGVYN